MGRRPSTLTPDRSVRHLFGAELRRHREQAEMSLDRLAAVVPFSKSHLSRVEMADCMIPPELPAHLDVAFNTGGFFERLYALARREIHPDKYRRRMELETRARSIGHYAGQLVPGLLQTEEYARALFRVSLPDASEEAIEEKVTARLSRRAALQANRRPHLSVVLDEAALRRPVGGAQVMDTQLAALAEQVDTPTCVIQVLPFAHGEHALMGGMLAILTLNNGALVAYEESMRHGHLLEDEESALPLSLAYDRLRAYALSPRSSAAFLRDIRSELRHDHP